MTSRHRRILSLLAAAVALTPVSTALAQTANPIVARESKVPPVISWLQFQGVKLTYLGSEGGLRGYIGESANGKMQTFYVTPDGEHVVAGILFRSGGDNVTGVQIGEMRARFEAASASLANATVDGEQPTPEVSLESEENTPEGGGAEAGEVSDVQDVKGTSEEAAPEPEVVEPDTQETTADTTDEASVGLELPAAEGPIAGAEGNPSEIWLSNIDKDEFLTKAESAPYFEVGSINAPATVWMVADPQCPYCHAAWDHMRSHVYSKKLKVRVILIAGLQGSEPISREMLSRPLPARAWLDSDAGRNLKLETDTSSAAYEKAGEFVEMNNAFAAEFGVDRTPFLGYVGQDGNFYTALGLPSDLGAFLAATGIK